MMNRRLFLKKLLSWLKKYFLFYISNSIIFNKLTMASQNKNSPIPDIEHLSLKELSRLKVHHNNDRFINPFNSTNFGNMSRLIKWKFFKKNHFKKYYDEEQVTPVNINWKSIKEHTNCAVTFIKHSSLMIKDMDQYIIVDPIFHGLFYFQDFTPIVSDIKMMPHPDYVLITHGHYDHLDTESLESLNNNTHVISPLGYKNIFEDINMDNHTQLDWFETYSDGDREIALLPCNHWSMRNPIIGPNDTLWGSYLIKGASGMNIFISGDLANFNRFKEIGREFKIDLAVFNLGAYEPRWFMQSSHINPEETVKAFLDLNATHLLIVHWGTFRLGDEPIHFPPIDINREMKKHGIQDRLINIVHGQTILYDKDAVQYKIIS